MEDNASDSVRERETETREWLESLDFVVKEGGPERVRHLLRSPLNSNRMYACP